MDSVRKIFFLFSLSFFLPSFLLAREPAKPPAVSQPNLFAEEFYLRPAEQIRLGLEDLRGFLFVPSPNREKNTRYAIVTDFAGDTFKAQLVPGLVDKETAAKWVAENLETAEFEGVQIRRLFIPENSPAAAGEKTGKWFYWIGHKSFEAAEQAQAQIALVQSVVASQGGNFSEMIKQAETYLGPEERPAVEIKTPAQYKREEEVILKLLDQLDIGNELFGPLQGVPSGEPITWQSFGETTTRKTNLSRPDYSSQVGFWTNRIVFKGIKAPSGTVDPFVEATAALESNGLDFASHLDLVAGFEWRPFGRNVWLYNFRPWSLPLLEWVRNLRIYVEYVNRKNLKDEILGSKDYDLLAGGQIFYEFGVEPPPLGEATPSSFTDYLRRCVWGEYFGNYFYDQTGFSTEKYYAAAILNSSIILGLKTPGLPLPRNPITDELVLMPYLRLEHVNNSEFSFFYQNYYFLGAGVRWMPFGNYRFKENEWLEKTKIFVEYDGIGGVHYFKTNESVPNDINHDFRVGVSFSQKRF